MASFWDNIGPGLIQTGGNLYLQNRAAQEAEKRLRRAQGPLYDQQQAMAGQSLNLAQGMDPKALAAERFAAQQALVAPGNEAERQDLMRKLQAQGMLGAASYAPVAGTVATPGTAMNPQMAALLAAQEGAKAKAAYGSLGEGEQYLNDLINRGGALNRQALGAQASGQQALAQIPRKPTLSEMLVKGAIKNPAVVKQAAGMLGQGASWLKGVIAPDKRDYFGGSDFSFGF